MASRMPEALSVPQAKQLCGVSSNGRTPLPGIAPASGVLPDASDIVGGFDLSGGASDVKVLDLAGLRLDEVLAGADLLTHEHREDLVGERGVLAVDAQERAGLRVHRRLPELVRVHLAESLEALHGEALDVHLLDDSIPLLLGLRIAGLLARADPVERRLGDVQI